MLTFPQASWPDKWALYKAGLSIWAKLRKRITAEFGRFRYVQTWERHQRGGAHLNVVICSEAFRAACKKRGGEWRHTWLAENLESVGFGWFYGIKPMYSAAGLAGYLTKLARELTGAGVKNQIPIDAPPHFRRLRASRDTLPPVMRGQMTGCLCFSPIKFWARFGALIKPSCDISELSEVFESSESSKTSELTEAREWAKTRVRPCTTWGLPQYREDSV